MAGGGDFYLDTKGFDEAAKICRDLAKKMENAKNNMDGLKNNLMFSWAGDGRNTFEKKYRLLSQMFGDLSDNLRDIADSIYEKEQTYIQADVDLAKATDGVDSRY